MIFWTSHNNNHHTTTSVPSQLGWHGQFDDTGSMLNGSIHGAGSITEVSMLSEASDITPAYLRCVPKMADVATCVSHAIRTTGMQHDALVFKFEFSRRDFPWAG